MRQLGSLKPVGTLALVDWQTQIGEVAGARRRGAVLFEGEPLAGGVGLAGPARGGWLPVCMLMLSFADYVVSVSDALYRGWIAKAHRELTIARPRLH